MKKLLGIVVLGLLTFVYTTSISYSKESDIRVGMNKNEFCVELNPLINQCKMKNIVYQKNNIEVIKGKKAFYIFCRDSVWLKKKSNIENFKVIREMKDNF